MTAPLPGLCELQWSVTSLWYLKLHRNLSAVFLAYLTFKIKLSSICKAAPHLTGR